MLAAYNSVSSAWTSALSVAQSGGDRPLLNRRQRFREHRRVYVAELIDGAWSVQSVNPDGTCEGVE